MKRLGGDNDGSAIGARLRVPPCRAEKVVPSRHFVICSYVFNDFQAFWPLAVDNKYAHVVSDVKNPLYFRSAGGRVCISIGLAHAACVFRWF